MIATERHDPAERAAEFSRVIDRVHERGLAASAGSRRMPTDPTIEVLESPTK